MTPQIAGITLRRAIASDSTQLANLWHYGLFDENNMNMFPNRLMAYCMWTGFSFQARWFGEMKNPFEYFSQPGRAMIVAVDDETGKVVGMVGLKECANDKEIGEEIRDSVSPDYRGRGIAKALLQTRWEVAKSLGYKKVFAWTGNPVAASIRTKFGYSSPEKHKYEKELE